MGDTYLNEAHEKAIAHIYGEIDSYSEEIEDIKSNKDVQNSA